MIRSEGGGVRGKKPFYSCIPKICLIQNVFITNSNQHNFNFERGSRKYQ